MRTVRIRVVDLVGDIVDVELDNEVIRHIVVHRRVDSCILGSVAEFELLTKLSS